MIYILLGVLILLALLAVVLAKVIGNKQKEEVLPYQAKKYFFSKSEQEFMRVLHENIDTQKYLIFPKVRLADFIEVTVKGSEYRGWWNKIRSKHIDFLIWDVQENKIALAIELDGKSHNSEKMHERDDFVNKIYKKAGIRLERVKVGDTFTDYVKSLNLL